MLAQDIDDDKPTKDSSHVKTVSCAFNSARYASKPKANARAKHQSGRPFRSRNVSFLGAIPAYAMAPNTLDDP
jgi:hypothetical protein